MKKNNKKRSFKLLSLFVIFLSYTIYFNLLYKILGERGAIFYIGTYSPIIIFLIIFLKGLPYSVSSIISRCDTLGYQKNKNKILKVLTICYIGISLLLVTLTFLLSDTLSSLIIKNNSISFEIKLVSFSLFFTCICGIYGGYYEGINHKEYSTITKVIGYIIKVISVVIVFILNLNVKISLKKVVRILIIGDILSYLIVMILLILLNKSNTKTKNKKEPKVQLMPIMSKSIKDAFIGALMYLVISFCFIFDILSLNQLLVDKINYKISSYETIISSMSLWGAFLIVPFIVIILRLLGNIKLKIGKYLIQKDVKNLSDYISSTYKKALFFTMPITILVCFCTSSVWKIIYSNSKYGILACQYLSILILGIVMFIVCFQILLSLKEYRMMYIASVVGVLIKFLFNTSLIYGLNKLGFPGFYGAITATFFAILIPSIIAIIYINNKYDVCFESVAKELFNIIIASIIMVIVLIILSNLLALKDNNNIIIVIATLVEFISGTIIYIYVTYKFKTIKNIF